MNGTNVTSNVVAGLSLVEDRLQEKLGMVEINALMKMRWNLNLAMNNLAQVMFNDISNSPMPFKY